MERTFRILSVFLSVFVFVGCGSNGVGSIDPFNENLTEFPPMPDDKDFVDRSHAVGFYADGSLVDADPFPEEGPGLLKIFRLRNRGFATDTLVRSLSLSASYLRMMYPNGERLQVGDISDHNGGQLAKHASHQNGLDADVRYLRVNRQEEDPNTTGPSGFHEVFVKNGKVTSNFDITRNWAILKLLVSRGNVGRIFVDPAIKKKFCDIASAIDPGISEVAKTEVLRRLRPYPNHADHFHLRLQCPKNHTRCIRQSEPPSGSGCGNIIASGEDEMTSSSLAPVDANDELGDDPF